jgi:ABC-type Fe3+/spermidine/putrescine transport system ATPase subunit
MLEIEQLAASAGDFRLGEIDLAVESGAYVVVLGPPGSGKSVLIETLCGLRPVTWGRVWLEGEDVTDLPPRHRRIGYVPQDYALFRHRRVRHNVTFGLRARGVSQAEADELVRPLIDLLHLEPLLDRWPGTLSGGEQQRVALARALATEPRLLLLDEPVSALDESSRDRVCRELRRIQHELGLATLHISHNLEEAFSVADVAVVMRDGRIVQRGTMNELVRRPQTPFVARFLRAQNVFDATADGREVRIGELTLQTDHSASGAVSVMIRPERIDLRAAAPDGANANVVPCVVERRVDRGPYVRIDLVGPVPLVANVSHHSAEALGGEPGARAWAVVQAADVYVMPPAGSL